MRAKSRTLLLWTATCVVAASLLSCSTKARWSLSCLRSVVTSVLFSHAGAAAAVAGGAGMRVCRDCSDCCERASGAIRMNRMMENNLAYVDMNRDRWVEIRGRGVWGSVLEGVSAPHKPGAKNET